MKEVVVQVMNETGLHARPAARLVQLATRFKSRIIAQKDHKQADLKSLLDLLSLGVCQNDRILIRAEGKDENRALEQIAALITELKD